MSTASPAELTYEQARDLAAKAIAIPHDNSFILDFLVDEHIGELASVLIQHCDELKFIEQFSVTYLWKRTGGKSKDRRTLGKCIKDRRTGQFLRAHRLRHFGWRRTTAHTSTTIFSKTDAAFNFLRGRGNVRSLITATACPATIDRRATASVPAVPGGLW
jgi:hypothetical protein